MNETEPSSGDPEDAAIRDREPPGEGASEVPTAEIPPSGTPGGDEGTAGHAAAAAPADEPPRPVLAPGALAAAVGDTGADAVEPGRAGGGPDPVGAVEPATGEEAPAQIDVSDPDAEALAPIPLARRVEALLFAAPEPLTLKRLKELTACPDGKAVRAAVEALAATLDAEQRAFRVEEVAQGFQLRTTAAVAPVVARLGRRPTEERLSSAALETLAVVAYRQPVLRADVEKIRGVACGEVLRALQERGLVRIAGRADLPGSPLLYGTTQRFLEIFGLRDLAELPRDRELLRPAPDRS